MTSSDPVLTSIDMEALDLSLAGLKAHYARGDFTPSELCLALRERAGKQAANPIFIHLLSRDEQLPYLDALGAEPTPDKPLWGVPFAIKDNIDLTGIGTTAACPAYRYVPDRSATSVARLLAAGAIPVGKTNLDQFAAGLNGTRSPYGAVRNALNPVYISGGSSSGSAVAVAAKLASFALGTDTAGSGRVPAALNGLVGLKPSRGIVSARGVVPACQSLDCVSVFSQTVADAECLLEQLVAFDPDDPYSRPMTPVPAKVPARPRLAIPKPQALAGTDEPEAIALFNEALEQASAWAELIEVDCTPLFAAAELLYRPPMVAERYRVVQSLLETNPDAVFPVTRQILESGAHATALELLEARHQLAAHAQAARPIFDACDALVLPTHLPAYTIEQVLADPIATNSALGRFTNFMNLLDLAGIAIPTGYRASGVGFGVTLCQRAFSDRALLELAGRWEAALR